MHGLNCNNSLKGNEFMWNTSCRVRTVLILFVVQCKLRHWTVVWFSWLAVFKQFFESSLCILVEFCAIQRSEREMSVGEEARKFSTSASHMFSMQKFWTILFQTLKYWVTNFTSVIRLQNTRNSKQSENMAQIIGYFLRTLWSQKT